MGLRMDYERVELKRRGSVISYDAHKDPGVGRRVPTAL